MRIISTYVLKEFLLYLFYCVLAFIAIFILIDTVENIDSFIDSAMPVKILTLYYLLSLPYIIVLTLPVAMLIATMFSLSRLVSDNEITAMKSSGISLYRVLSPLYIFSLFIGIVTMVFAEEVVPTTNLYRKDIEDLAKIRKMDRNADISFSFSKNREMDRQNVFLANRDGRIINTLLYRSHQQTAERVYIFEPLDATKNSGDKSGENGGGFAGFKSRIDADSMTYSDGVWYLHNATERLFERDGEVKKFFPSMKASFITLAPSDFARIDVKPEEMNYFELSRYIMQINSSGGDASEWLVDLNLKLSFPFVSFVIVFFGAPMAAGSTKRGKTASFGIALAICFFFYTLINGFQILGRTGAMNPFVAAWLPNAIFLIFGFDMHLRAKK